MSYNRIVELLGDRSDFLLNHKCETVRKEQLHLPGPDFIERVVAQSNRTPQVLRNLQAMFSHGRLAGTGYLSILPVDQGIEHSAGASFAPNLSILILKIFVKSLLKVVQMRLPLPLESSGCFPKVCPPHTLHC
jgi:hypothetical protein